MSYLHPDALLYRLEGALTELTMIGPVADGVRMVNRFGGPVTTGDLAGARVDGIDYFRVRRDGVGVVDAREVVTLDGQRVAVEVHGYALPPAGMPAPPPEALVSPGFAWPDVPFAIEASATFATAEPQLAYLNRLIVAHVGWVNMSTLDLVIDVYRLTPAEQPAGAGAARA